MVYVALLVINERIVDVRLLLNYDLGLVNGASLKDESTDMGG